MEYFEGASVFMSSCAFRGVKFPERNRHGSYGHATCATKSSQAFAVREERRRGVGVGVRGRVRDGREFGVRVRKGKGESFILLDSTCRPTVSPRYVAGRR